MERNRSEDATTSERLGPPGITLIEWINLYDQFRKYLAHEDDLVNQRTTWAMTIQAFNIAAVGWVFTAMITELNVNDYFRAFQCRELIQFFCAIGIGVNIISAVGIFAAQIAIRCLERDWSVIVADSVYQKYFPKLSGGGSRRALQMGHSVPLLLPLFLMILWILLLFYMRIVKWDLGLVY